MPKDKSESAGAGASVAVAGTGLGVTEAESFSWGDIARMLAVLSAQVCERQKLLDRFGEELERLEKVRRVGKFAVADTSQGKFVGFEKEPPLVEVEDGVGLFDVTPGMCIFNLDLDFDGRVSFQNNQEFLDNVGQDKSVLATERDNSGGYPPLFY